jgi:hypothetical protein
MWQKPQTVAAGSAVLGVPNIFEEERLCLESATCPNADVPIRSNAKTRNNVIGFFIIYTSFLLSLCKELKASILILIPPA